MSQSISPEERCLGSLMKLIDKDSDISSKETKITTLDEKLSIFDSINSSINSTINSSINSGNVSIPPPKPFFNPILSSRQSILLAFNEQKSTIILQKFVMSAPKEILAKIIEILRGSYSIIIRNKNGNYFFSDLVKNCGKDLRIEILKELSSSIAFDCLDEYGTHPIQILIQNATCVEEYKLLLASFDHQDKIKSAALNSNGTFVIQKLLIFIPEQYRIEFNVKFSFSICDLSIDKFGVCSLIKYINYTKNEYCENQVLKSILSKFIEISANQYGNYLIQNILKLWWITDKGYLLKNICIQYFHILAINNYSSYICDVFLSLSSYDEKLILVKYLYNNNLIDKFTKSNTGKIILNKLMMFVNNQNILIGNVANRKFCYKK